MYTLPFSPFSAEVNDNVHSPIQLYMMTHKRSFEPCLDTFPDFNITEGFNKTPFPADFCWTVTINMYKLGRNPMVCSVEYVQCVILLDCGYMLVICRKISMSLVSIRQLDHIELNIHFLFYRTKINKVDRLIVSPNRPHGHLHSIHTWVISVHCMMIYIH